MRFLLIPPAKYQALFLGILILVIVWVAWFLMKVNDICRGALGRWLNRMLDWLIAQQKKRL